MKKLDENNDNRIVDNFYKSYKKSTKHLFGKTCVCLVFFAGFSKIGVDIEQTVKKYIDEKHKLPYNDEVTIPFPDDSIAAKFDYYQAVFYYKKLLKSIYKKADSFGVELDDTYKMYTLAYDNMSKNLDLILGSGDNFVSFKYSGQEVTKSQLDTIENTLSDQVSFLTSLIGKIGLLDISSITALSNTLEQQLTNNVDKKIDYYAYTKEYFSDGNEREPIADSNIINGVDYQYFNVYGKATIDEKEYNTVTTIAMNKDSYEILEINNLIKYYTSNPTDSNFVINTNYQEDNNILDVLNSPISTNTTSDENSPIPQN